MRRAFYDEELDYGLNYEDLDEYAQEHVRSVLNSFEGLLCESDNKEYMRIRMDCPNCTNELILCTRCQGINSYECPLCGGDRVYRCERCPMVLAALSFPSKNLMRRKWVRDE